MFPLLEIKNLGVDFKIETGNASAVKNISFQVNRGETLAIVGESGSGKTVTSLSILQLLPSSAKFRGEILFSKNINEQVNLITSSAKQLQRLRGNEIAMIFQEPMTSLNPVQTCGKQVEESIRLHQGKNKSHARKLTIELFAQAELPDPERIINRYPHQLSGGQKQRVMIAMAMSSNPALLIADEPTTALDVTVQKTILNLLKKLQQRNNMGMIYITHDLSLVAEIADKVILMYKGAIAEQGSVKEIFLSPQHSYTKALLSCRLGIHIKGERLPVIDDFLHSGARVNEKENATPREVPFKEKIIEKIPAEKNKSFKILEVKNLDVSFSTNKNFFGKSLNKIKAVDNVSFDIIQGETIGLVGESGCGKTTLGRTIIRLIEPSSGDIFFREKNISHLSKEEMRKLRRDIQIIFQDPYGSLNPRMSIGNAILEPMKVHNILQNDKQRKEKVVMLLEKVNLSPNDYDRYPHQFSGGQRQRICIIRALGLNPRFIICDESVSALDVSIQAQILNLLNDLKKEFGYTSIFISHDLNIVKYMSDRIFVMNKGKIVESGTAHNIYYHPKNEYTQRLIEAIPKGLVA